MYPFFFCSRIMNFSGLITIFKINPMLNFCADLLFWKDSFYQCFLRRSIYKFRILYSIYVFFYMWKFFVLFYCYSEKFIFWLRFSVIFDFIFFYFTLFYSVRPMISKRLMNFAFGFLNFNKSVRSKGKWNY